MTFNKKSDDDPHLSSFQKKPRKPSSGSGWQKWLLPALTISFALTVAIKVGIHFKLIDRSTICFFNVNSCNQGPVIIPLPGPTNNHTTNNYNTHTHINRSSYEQNSDSSQRNTENKISITNNFPPGYINPSNPATTTLPQSPKPEELPPRNEPTVGTDLPAEPISNYPTNPTPSWNDAVPSVPARVGPDPRQYAPQYAVPTLPPIDAQPNFDTPEVNPPITPEPIPTNEPNPTTELPSIATYQGNPSEVDYPGADLADTVPEPPAAAGIIAIVSAIGWITKQLRLGSEN